VTSSKKLQVLSGEYYITVKTNFEGTEREEAVVVYCDFEDQHATTYFKLDAQRYAQDVREYEIVNPNPRDDEETHPHDKISETETKYKFRYPTCEQFGFINFQNPTKEQELFAQQTFGSAYSLVTAPRVHTDRRLCTITEEQAFQAYDKDNLDKAKLLPAQRAETGNYVITYFVSDLSKNGQQEKCNQGNVKRTVIVEDTLPPVLSLKYRGNILTTGDDGNHVGAASADRSKEDNGKHYNPAYYKLKGYPDKKTTRDHQQLWGNPQFNAEYTLMAQAATTNGWLIAAVASGIAGVALFGFSLKKSNMNVPVPV